MSDNERRETHAAVIADVRGLAEHRDWNNHTRQSNRERVSDIADRLEAAHGRELAASGNAAKLREALESIASNLEHRLFARYPSSASDEWMYQKANAALASPPRNCDRFANIDEARKAHEAICEKYGKCHNGCPLNNEEHYSAFDCFEAWLFAPATEQKGVTDGN